VGRRHPDIGQDRIGLLLFDRRQEGVGVGAEADHIDVADVLEDVLERLADEVLIVTDDQPNTFDRHLRPPSAIQDYRRRKRPVSSR
jgi:hypothetical protein